MAETNDSSSYELFPIAMTFSEAFRHCKEGLRSKSPAHRNQYKSTAQHFAALAAIFTLNLNVHGHGHRVMVHVGPCSTAVSGASEMMQQSNGNNDPNKWGDGHDLELATSVDGSVRQNVPIPPRTNSVLSGMISSSSASTASSPSTPSPSAYTPSVLPTGLNFSQSSHPIACLFHILFKGIAFALYMLGSKMMDELMVTVLCILLLAADFWVVKNITGRLLVGLRWWNKVDPVSGKTNWIFESAAPAIPPPTIPSVGGGGVPAPAPAMRINNSFDSKFFWTVLYITPAIWCLLFLSAMLWLEFQCFVLLSCALVLSGSNVYGYYKCSADQRERWNEWINTGTQMGMSAMMNNSGMFGWVRNRLFGGVGRQRVPQQDPNVMSGTFA